MPGQTTVGATHAVQRIPVEFETHLARPCLVATALSAGDKHDVVLTRLYIEKTAVRERLHVIAAERRQSRLSMIHPDPSRDLPRGISVTPDSANHTNGINLAED